jgi:hypothetical protein
MPDVGWRSQSVWLRVLLLVSLLLIVIGVYRCSTELTPQGDSDPTEPEAPAMAEPSDSTGTTGAQ